MKQFPSKTTLRAVTAVFCLSFSASSQILRADDVIDSIEEARKAYNDKDYAVAAQALETAAQLVKQKRAESLTKYLPKPPSGWKAEEPSSQAAAASFFGGGVTAEREYSKGDTTVTIKILTDSPMMQGIMMMMGNPMFASADGGKLTRLKGQRAIVKYDASNRSGSINVVVGGMILVQIEGNDCTSQDLNMLAEAIDYAGLAGAL